MNQLLTVLRNRMRGRSGFHPDSGWGTADQGGSGVIGVLGVVFVAGLIWGLWRLFNGGSETTNISDIATKTKGYMGDGAVTTLPAAPP